MTTYELHYRVPDELTEGVWPTVSQLNGLSVLPRVGQEVESANGRKAVIRRIIQTVDYSLNKQRHYYEVFLEPKTP